MTRDAALSAILAEFPQASAEQLQRIAAGDLTNDSERINVTSGGIRASRDVEPALYASRDLAIAAFQRETLTALRERKPAAIHFVDGPHVDKWNITVMDSRGTQRVAEQRWSVTAQIRLIYERGQPIPLTVDLMRGGGEPVAEIQYRSA